MSTVKSFQELEIWQLAVDLDKRIDMLTKTAPVSKDISFTDQVGKSVKLIAVHIAKGYDTGSWLKFIRYLSMARSAASEVQSQLILGFEKDYFSKASFDELYNLTEQAGNKIDGLIRYLNHSEIKASGFRDISTKKEQQEMENNIINTAGAAKPLGAYPHARRVGNLLFLSGIGSRSAKDNTIPGLELDAAGNILKYDIEAECHSVFANVKAVLEASGSSWQKIVDVTVFLTNMKTDFPVYNKVYGDYFKDVNACRTTVEVKSLPTPIAIELKVIATID